MIFVTVLGLLTWVLAGCLLVASWACARRAERAAQRAEEAAAYSNVESLKAADQADRAAGIRRPRGAPR